jgi:hypothetical protein
MRAWSDVPMWGGHLEIDHDHSGKHFVDADGNRFGSLREAFWRGRLNMADYESSTTEVMLETIQAALSAKAFRDVPRNSEVTDIYDGSSRFFWFVTHWIHSEGLSLVSENNGSPSGGEISEAGKAVLLMLDATRPGDRAGLRTGRTSIAALAAAVEAARVDRNGIETLETISAGWPSRFVRVEIGEKPAITLKCRPNEAKMPITRTVWSLPFMVEHSRDVMFEWICDHVDRWDDWAEKAYRSGGAELTRRMLVMMAMEANQARGSSTDISLRETSLLE